MALQGIERRALIKGALFVLAFCHGQMRSTLLLAGLLFSPAVLAVECLASTGGELAQVSYVYDGDTVRLADGRKVRLIGINTPEIARKEQPAEPLAREAKVALSALLKEPAVVLVFDRERHDRYKRLLAHVYLPDGRSVQRHLLRRGLAAAVSLPPNLVNQSCYFAAEQQARSERIGIWRQLRYRGVDSRDLTPGNKGFYVVAGMVDSVGESRKSYWLNFPGDFSVRIAKNELDNFSGLDVQLLAGRQVRVRGWLYPVKGRLRMGLRHRNALEFVE